MWAARTSLRGISPQKQHFDEINVHWSSRSQRGCAPNGGATVCVVQTGVGVAAAGDDGPGGAIAEAVALGPLAAEREEPVANVGGATPALGAGAASVAEAGARSAGGGCPVAQAPNEQTFARTTVTTRRFDLPRAGLMAQG